MKEVAVLGTVKCLLETCHTTINVVNESLTEISELNNRSSREMTDKLHLSFKRTTETLDKVCSNTTSLKESLLVTYAPSLVFIFYSFYFSRPPKRILINPFQPHGPKPILIIPWLLHPPHLLPIIENTLLAALALKIVPIVVALPILVISAPKPRPATSAPGKI